MWVLLRDSVSCGFVLDQVGRVVRHSVGIGFGLWRNTLSWALWPFFAAVVAGLVALGWLLGDNWPWIGLLCGVLLVYMGVVTCLAYMFIDLGSCYEVGRGRKARLHNPLKGQKRHGGQPRAPATAPQVGLPLLFAASLAACLTGIRLAQAGAVSHSRPRLV